MSAPDTPGPPTPDTPGPPTPGTTETAQAPEGRRRRWWRVLLPAAPDVVGLLVTQGELTIAGVDAFAAWSGADGQAMAEGFRATQHQAHGVRRELMSALQAALSTPVDQEDLFILSERIDRILSEARDTMREAEVLGRAPDAHTARMADRLAAGTRELVAGFGLLHSDPQAAGVHADGATRAVRHVERDYREAMADLLQGEDLRAVVAGQILYRRYLSVTDAVIAVADRLWFAVLRAA